MPISSIMFNGHKIDVIYKNLDELIEEIQELKAIETEISELRSHQKPLGEISVNLKKYLKSFCGNGQPSERPLPLSEMLSKLNKSIPVYRVTVNKQRIRYNYLPKYLSMRHI